MTEFCWFLKFIFLLVMMSNWQIAIARPVHDNPPSELNGGNDFLKMFFEHQQFHDNDGISVADEIGKPASNNRSYNARSLDYKARRNGNGNENENEHKDDKQQQQEQQQVVKLVTSGSKIVFLEEYDDDDAVVDAVAREIDLQREQKLVKHNNHNNRPPTTTTTTTTTTTKSTRNIKQQQQTSNTGEQYQVVAVSVSSSSKRGNEKQQHYRRQQFKQQSTTTRAPKIKKTTQKATTSTTPKTVVTTTTTTTTPPTTTTTTNPKRRPIAALPYDNAHFINLSHKSELSIEETEPLTMTPRKQQPQQQQQQQHIHLPSLDTLSDSENSASTNVQNVLAAPLSHQNNKTTTSTASASGSHASTDDSDMEDKLLPFQTVIYHDTRSGEGHGPQSRSISYSSLSQNVEDIHSWQRSTGILAEAQRNVNESLKPTLNTKSNTKSESEPARFYSVPAKMYGEPAKFYSEPAKVYSEPAKVYGEPEKIYSEPAKVYGEPSKYYSEPAKVYSQPAKVYGEPAKTYWPQTESTSTSTTTVKPAYMPPSRRPAIVSRIAFGEAQTSSTTTTTTSTTTVRPPIVYRNHHSHYTQTRLHNQQQKHGHVNTQPRHRVLFNLDRLPYDLLNAPEPTASKQPQQQHPAEPTNLADLAHGPISCFESELPLTASVSTSSASSATAIANTAVSSLTVTHQPQQQQLLLIQQQHSSLSDQHSNQNAKRLPNRDLVKCVAKYIHPNGVGLPDVPVSVPAASHQTTERSHSEDIYSPTPEQNYEIEESVSVMTDGRAHGVVGGSMAGQIAGTSTARPAHQRGAIRGNTSSLTTSLYHQQQQQHGANANANKHHNHNNDDDGNYNYDEDDNEDDGNTDEKAGDDDDDSKVAYVVEGQNYRKYRVEEKTDDGFIVGEYGVVDHNDGNLRGVRYTADSTINPSLIQKALLTFLKLK